MPEVIGLFRGALGYYRKGEFDARSSSSGGARAASGRQLSATYIERCEYLKAHPPRACGRRVGDEVEVTRLRRITNFQRQHPTLNFQTQAVPGSGCGRSKLNVERSAKRS